MIPYEVYKIIHLTSLIILFISFSLSLIAEKNIKIFKILAGVTTLLILVSGMGLMARIGISHGLGWPVWVKLKFVYWALLGIGVPVVIKRVNKKYHQLTFWISIAIFVLAAATANYKP